MSAAHYPAQESERSVECPKCHGAGRVSDELPGVAEPQAILLNALARACQLTADKLKAEAGEREARLMGMVE